ncbi:hypothetical protein QQS21_000442 [Conoideocrella luteorostrata]|uniref:Uncharacterized protein n=1 Tax=Conoideocrella luteorostrata TaxID=1105319 RepID=A0AAJ0D1R1_9HYPO|nr:hypothetical protein QQS21_000442 [Conoideocrella luteorostrata]
MASNLDQNVLGYELGEISARGAVTVEIVTAGHGVPLQTFIDVQYQDSKVMDKRPGMYLKYLPYRYDEVTGKLLSGGSYLFDTWENAKDYVRWTNEDFKVGDPEVKFWDQPAFESHNGTFWRVIGAHNFVPIQQHAVGRLQQWACEAIDVETVLHDIYPSLRSAAEAHGAASIWLLHNPEEKTVGIQLAFQKLGGAGDHESARQSLVAATKPLSLGQFLPETFDLKPLFDRVSLFLTLWLPKSTAAGGAERTIPLYPMVPNISCHDA